MGLPVGREAVQLRVESLCSGGDELVVELIALPGSLFQARHPVSDAGNAFSLQSLQGKILVGACMGGWTCLHCINDYYYYYY